MILWSGAPSSGTACSLELSLPSPAGIWFKTPLPVGGANTAELPPRGELVSQHPRGRLMSTSEAGSVGVASNQNDRGIPTKPAGGLLSNIGSGGPCLRLTGHAIPDRPKDVLTSLSGSPSFAHEQAHPGTTISTIQQEWDPLPEGGRRVMGTTSWSHCIVSATDYPYALLVSLTLVLGVLCALSPSISCTRRWAGTGVSSISLRRLPQSFCFLPLFFFFFLSGRKPLCHQFTDFKLKGGKWSPGPQ